MSRTSDKLTGNAIALMATTGITSLLGIAFWAVAARLFSAEEVGRASAQVAGATLLAGLAQLNLVAVIVRFLPLAGRRMRIFLVRCYAVTAALAVVLTVVFLAAGFGRGYLSDSLLQRGLFLLAVVLFLLTPLTDASLVALRAAPVVLLENALLAVLKLGLLVSIASRWTGIGILASWLAPSLVLVVSVTAYLFLMTLPRSGRDEESTLPGGRKMASFVAAEYLKSVLSTVGAMALPLFVTAHLGLSANAYFAVPWMIATSTGLLLFNVSTSFVVETINGKGDHRSLLRRNLVLVVAVTTVATVVPLIGAPYLLAVLGHDYAAEGTSVMRLLALALPFTAVNSLYGTFAWLDTRLWRLLGLQAANMAMLFAGSELLVDEFGIEGVALAYLISQVVLGVGSLPPVLRRIRRATCDVSAPPASQPVIVPAGQ